jgi:hypothetical protein
VAVVGGAVGEVGQLVEGLGAGVQSQSLDQADRSVQVLGQVVGQVVIEARTEVFIAFIAALPELARVAGEPGRAADHLACRRRGRLVLAGLLEHPGDLGDVDDVELERAGAGGIDRRRAIAADQAE